MTNILDAQKIVNWVNDSVKWLLKNNDGCAEYKLDDDLSIFCGWSDGYDKDDDSGIKPTDEQESTWRINVGIKSNHEYLKTDFDWLNFPYDKDTGDVVDTGLTVGQNGITLNEAQWLIDSYKGIREDLDNGSLLLEAKFKDKVKAIKTSLKKNDKRLSDKTAQKSAEEIAGSMVKNESMKDYGLTPSQSFLEDIYSKLSLALELEDGTIDIDNGWIEFVYNGNTYYAEPSSTFQIDVFDENHNKIAYNINPKEIKLELFTEYNDEDYVYQLVGGDKSGNYTKDQLVSMNIITDNTGENLGRRKELKNQPIVKGYLGPMFNGFTDEGKPVIRYETQEVYDQLSESKKLDEIALRVPNTEIAKKPEDSKETIGDLLNEIDNALSISEIDEIAKKFKKEIDRRIIEDEIAAIEEEYDDVYEIDEDSEEYEDILNELKSCILSDFSGEEDNLNESKKLQEDEIIDRPEDLVKDSEEDEAIHYNEDKSEKTVIDYLEERIGQEIDAGRLNSILQSIFGMYNRTFIMPDDLYNMDLDSTQTLNIDIDGDEYTIYYDIIDVDAGIIKITDVEVL